MSSYILSVLGYLLRRGEVLEAGRSAAAWVAARGSKRTQLIFVNTLGHTPALARDDRPGATTITVEPTDLTTLTPWRATRPSARYDVATAVRQGADLWTIDEDGSRIGFIVTKRPHAIASYFLPLPDDSAYVCYSYIEPERRGGGRFGRARAALLDHLHARGVRWLVTNCDAWNVPARRAIERTGARLVGRGWKARDGARHFLPLAAPPWSDHPAPEARSTQTPGLPMNPANAP